jgi:hypothetical protein
MMVSHKQWVPYTMDIYINGYIILVVVMGYPLSYSNIATFDVARFQQHALAGNSTNLVRGFPLKTNH